MGRSWAVWPLLLAAQRVAAQQQPAGDCFSGGDIVGAVIGTVAALAILGAAGYVFWKYYWTRRQDGKTLTLVTNDPEAGLADDHYAFDNPGFLTEDASPQKKAPLKTPPHDGKSTIERNNINVDASKGVKGGKWQAWAPFSAFVGNSSGKGKNSSFKAMDDSFVGEPERDFVPLKGHDFTGLGFNICGNMREGIYVRDVLHRGPASESGRIAAGDRIVSISISLRHMVFEDALTILSYASPYDVQLEIEKRPPGRVNRDTGSGKRSPSVGPPDRLCHPFYRSQSIDDLNKMRMSSMGARQVKVLKKPEQLSQVSVVSTSSRKETSRMEKEAAPATRSNVTMPKPERTKKPTTSTTSVASVPDKKPTSAEKMAKFGVKVLPLNLSSELGQKLETKSEATENEQNKKIEEEEEVVHEMAVDVPDKMGQVVNEMKFKVEQEKQNIPTELPEEMRLAAQAAVSHRKSLKEAAIPVAEPEPDKSDKTVVSKESVEESDKKKRRAPPPPKFTAFADMQQQFEDNMSKAEEVVNEDKPITIELGSSQVTIHQAAKDEHEGGNPGKGRERKAASLGDLSRFDSEQPMSIPLERAVSLDMVDVNEESNTGTAKKRKVAPPVSIVANSETAMTDTSVEEDEEEELTPTNSPLRKEQPVMIDLAGASDTFNRRLKKSSQWGTLEDAISFERQELKTVITVDEETSGPASITYITPDAPAPPTPPTSPPPTVTFVSTATPTVQHVTEIQVLSSGGTVSEKSLDFAPSTTIRHGTSGGSLLLVASSLDDELQPTTFNSSNSNHVDKEPEEEEEEVEERPELVNVQVSTSNVTVTPVNLEKEVMQISAAELDDIMMSHSSYLKTTDNQYSTFEQWVFLDQAAEEGKKKEVISPVANHETNHVE
ncbi:protein AHNAK2-like [Neocloeon triangulifer]|uniref:protein AHNAK2-like n=1 Tax=Neocloeon triangulifer TaxID=2078957 RepID=UPI00286F2AB8|nr:protein AHNAK2-like [Neocloeon triangulifer]